MEEGTVSYYFSHIIECDQLAYDRMLEAWKQKIWADRCVLGRPDHVWVLSGKTDISTKNRPYLLFGMFNHRPTHRDAVDWLTDELGIGSMHLTIWTRGENDDEWSQWGSYAPNGEIPIHTVLLNYDEEKDRMEDAPEGYRTYECCDIAVDPDIWAEVAVDYTRDEEPYYPSPLEEALLRIDDNLNEIRRLLELFVERTED
jgi:hypothetical protein